jgi:hypothetical protein
MHFDAKLARRTTKRHEASLEESFAYLFGNGAWSRDGTCFVSSDREIEGDLHITRLNSR